jgi:hypothetical protein
MSWRWARRSVGRPVAETTVRRTAANLGLSKTTVRKHLSTLREYGLVFHEELREAASGRYPSRCARSSTRRHASSGSPLRRAPVPGRQAAVTRPAKCGKVHRRTRVALLAASRTLHSRAYGGIAHRRSHQVSGRRRPGCGR